jgi:hypothetical protein
MFQPTPGGENINIFLAAASGFFSFYLKDITPKRK